MLTVLQRARVRYSDYHGMLFHSDLTMVHDIAGEVSPDVTESMKEKTKLAKAMTIKSIDMEMESLSATWLGRNLFATKIGNLKQERAEIVNF